MAAARRCPVCKTDWPTQIAVRTGLVKQYKPGYIVCPECRRGTVMVQDGKPLPEGVALSRKNHGDFEEFFKQWDAEREKQVAEMELTFNESPSLES